LISQWLQPSLPASRSFLPSRCISRWHQSSLSWPFMHSRHQSGVCGRGCVRGSGFRFGSGYGYGCGRGNGCVVVMVMLTC
jgi:hypothetical protein